MSQRENQTLVEKVFDHVVENIATGVYPPASKITQERLAKELNISHVPVREAMERLQHHGWVVRIPQKGAYVKNFSNGEMKEIYEIRQVLELHAVRILASQITTEQLAELDEAVGKLEKALDSGDAKLSSQADMEFHGLLFHFLGNKRLAQMYQTILLQSHCFFVASAMNVIWQLRKNLTKRTDADHHRLLYEALAAHNTKRAESLIKDHMAVAHRTSVNIRELCAV